MLCRRKAYCRNELHVSDNGNSLLKAFDLGKDKRFRFEHVSAMEIADKGGKGMKTVCVCQQQQRDCRE